MPLATPRFWYQRRRSWQAWLLYPLGWLYGCAVTLHRCSTLRWRCSVPVLSIGNLTLGGTGKTPLGIALAKGLEERGWRVAVLLRGYGARRRSSCQVSATSPCAEVGDEALEYAQSLGAGVAWVGSNRCQSAALAVAAGATVILLDDGLQHWRLGRDLDLSLLDSQHGLGNRLVFPAGPLREPLDQLARADGLVFTGAEPFEALPPIPLGWPSHKPRFAVRFCLLPPPQLQHQRLVAFCGIGLPEKFFSALRACGFQLVATESFPDHHVYAESDLECLLDLADANSAHLVTTVKDGQRLPHRYRHVVSLVPLQVESTSLAPLLNWLDQRLGALSDVRFYG
ncbi:MAG: tetraacyldisaccharide 4'-kinase [Cyanobacteria bacterium]|nr:tetraacyldisaccharide 4'-kinase [Cyanobacteriota bacterium]MDA1245756.1 tetraacyldisaccharide 4'-kinase [Cyanobacteriota bacterium]